MNSLDYFNVVEERKSVLLSTRSGVFGGVSEMLRFIVDCLTRENYEPIVAYYEPYGVTPKLSVPSFKLFRRSIGSLRVKTSDGYEANALGAWLPELEFTHYLPTRSWKDLMHACQYHISVSGNCLAATPFALTGLAYLSWVATPWLEDRKDRTVRFSMYRKILDRTVVHAVIRPLERHILRKGSVLALSEYTSRKLDLTARRAVAYDVMHKPVDLVSFTPGPAKVIHGRIGFVGRYDDPRKNVLLLLKALVICRERGLPVTAELIGGKPRPDIVAYVVNNNLDDIVKFESPVQHCDLPDRFRSFDVFVIPSYQEGLCIAALEAMACGCPVISTQCGGPEEFVIKDKTGYLVGHEPIAMADAIAKVITHRDLREKLSASARKLVTDRYNAPEARKRFWRAFDHAFRS